MSVTHDSQIGTNRVVDGSITRSLDVDIKVNLPISADLQQNQLGNKLHQITVLSSSGSKMQQNSTGDIHSTAKFDENTLA